MLLLYRSCACFIFSLGAANQVDPAELLSMLTVEEEKDAKRTAIKALEQHPASVAVEPLVKMLEDEDAGVRTATISSLGKFKKDALPAADKLTRMTSEDPDKRVQAGH